MTDLRRIWPFILPGWLGIALAAWFRMDPRFLFLANALAAIWCIGLLAGCAPEARSALDWPLLFVVLWLPVNYWVSPDKQLSISAAANLLAGIAIFYLVVVAGRMWVNPQWPFYLYLVGGVGLLLVGVLAPGGLPQTSTRPDALETIAYRFPDAVNANVLAGALLPGAVVAGGLALAPGSSSRRASNLLFLVAAVLMIAMTGSRGALLGLAAGIGALALILGGPFVRAGMALLAAAALAVALFIVRGFGSGPVLGQLDANMAADSLSDRVEIWSHTGQALLHFPLTGVGIGAFRDVIPRLYPFTRLNLHAVPHAHNLTLQAGVDLGLPGLLALSFVFGAALLSAARSARQSTSLWQRYAAAGAFGALIAVLVHGIFDATLWGTKPAFLLWWLLALAMLANTCSPNGRRSSSFNHTSQIP